MSGFGSQRNADADIAAAKEKERERGFLEVKADRVSPGILPKLTRLL